MLEDPYEFQPQPQSRFWGWTLVAWLSALGLFCAGLACCTGAAAAQVFKADNNGDYVALRLIDAPCTDEKVLVHLRGEVTPRVLAKFKAAALTWGGRVWASCGIEWRGAIYSIDEEGSPFQPVPIELFRDDSV